jgi:hypothetical protein
LVFGSSVVEIATLKKPLPYRQRLGVCIGELEEKRVPHEKSRSFTDKMRQQGSSPSDVWAQVMKRICNKKPPWILRPMEVSV